MSFIELTDPAAVRECEEIPALAGLGGLRWVLTHQVILHVIRCVLVGDDHFRVTDLNGTTCGGRSLVGSQISDHASTHASTS